MPKHTIALFLTKNRLVLPCLLRMAAFPPDPELALPDYKYLVALLQVATVALS